MRFHFLNKPWIGFGILICLSALIIGLVLEQFNHASRAREWVMHTYEVINQIDSLSARIAEAESSQRGFALSGKPHFLQAFRNALQSDVDDSKGVEQDLEHLAMLVKDNEVQRVRMQALIDAVHTKVAYMNGIVNKVIDESPAAVQQMNPTNRGYELMQVVHKLITEMRVEESNLLSQRVSDYEFLNRSILYLTLGLVTLLILTMGASLFSSGREYKRRLHNEHKLSQMAAFQRGVLNASEYAIIVSSTDGIIRMVNPATERMLGYRADELVDKITPEIFHDAAEVAQRAAELSHDLGEDIQPGYEVFVTLPLRHGLEEREWTYLTKDGKRLPVSLTVTILRDTQGKITGYMGMAKDITERREIERMKNEFISTVSHELRTPLTSIRGSLALIAGNVAGQLPPKAASLIGIAHKNTERLVRLINNILDIEKIESGRILFERKPVQVGLLLEQAAADGHGFTEEYGVSIDVDSDCGDAVIIGDMDRLQQVILNLLSNAAKFSPANERVVLRARRGASNCIEISVQDQGPGIPEEFRGRIFGKFAQADSQDTRQKSGSGLGLSISKAITESMDGHLEFTSRPGETIFTVRLPEATKAAHIETVPVVGASAPRILICEDDPDISALLEIILGREGFFCSVAHSAKEARALLAIQKFTAMTLDMGLPDANGLDLIRELREKESTRDLPVIVISAQNKNQNLEAAAFGIIDWVTKPIDQSRLRTALQSLFVKKGDERPCVLHIEDDHDIISFLATAMDDVDIVPAPTLAIARLKLKERRYDLAVLDVYMPDGNGLDLLPELSAQDIPVIILSVHETSRDIQEYVCGSMVKTVVSEKKIIETIKTFIGRSN